MKFHFSVHFEKLTCTRVFTSVRYSPLMSETKKFLYAYSFTFVIWFVKKISLYWKLINIIAKRSIQMWVIVILKFIAIATICITNFNLERLMINPWYIYVPLFHVTHHQTWNLTSNFRSSFHVPKFEITGTFHTLQPVTPIKETSQFTCK